MQPKLSKAKANNANVSEREANALWGGRFAEGPDAIMQAINASVDFDKALAAHDIAGSKAHVAMLAEQQILTAQDAAAITEGLTKIQVEIEEGVFSFSPALEDVHMNIEARLAELIGAAAGRLHTGRSRNDQVATDFKLWVRDALDRLDGALKACQAALIDRADHYADTPMPGFTHLQTAQPVTFGHHLLAYVEMFGRDRDRVADCRARLNQCPLGSAALAGTGFPIDRDMTAHALGFDSPTRNSLDAVSDRDFALEYLAVASIAVTHITRLADELVLWSSDLVGFVSLSDRFSTGSSIMPQKRNPDAAELARGKSGRIFGHLVGLLTVLKGLPLAYSKDMQEDKEPVFDTDETIMLCLAALTGMISDMQPKPEAMLAALEKGFPTATDLADWLVREAGLPFREAHHVTGRAVKLAEDKGVGLDALTDADLAAIDPRLTADVRSVLSVEASLASRSSFGGTAPQRVREAVGAARKLYL